MTSNAQWRDFLELLSDVRTLLKKRALVFAALAHPALKDWAKGNRR
jgi:hypothetical protein